jgi:hypothetical protein
MSFAVAGRTTADGTSHPAKTSRFRACRLATQSIDLGSLTNRRLLPLAVASAPSFRPTPWSAECLLGFGTCVARLGLLAPRPDRPVLAKNLLIARVVRRSSAKTSRRTRVVPISSEITTVIVVSNPSGNGIAMWSRPERRSMPLTSTGATPSTARRRWASQASASAGRGLDETWQTTSICESASATALLPSPA